MLLIPFEVCLETGMKWSELDHILAQGTVESEVVKRVTTAYVQLLRKSETNKVEPVKTQSRQLEKEKNKNSLGENSDINQSFRTPLDSDRSDSGSFNSSEPVSQLSSLDSNFTLDLTAAIAVASATVSAPNSNSTSLETRFSSSNSDEEEEEEEEEEESSSKEVEVDGRDFYSPCDAYAMACYLDEKLIQKREIVWGKMILDGGVDTKGMIAYDWSKKKTNKHPNIELVMKINRKGFVNRVQQACSADKTIMAPLDNPAR